MSGSREFQDVTQAVLYGFEVQWGKFSHALVQALFGHCPDLVDDRYDIAAGAMDGHEERRARMR